jgi:predicted RNase H-like HicB family nuclease
VRYAVLLEPTGTGYSAHVPDLSGCIAAGDTLEETVQLMREAIRIHLKGLSEDGEPIPEPTTIAEYVAAA